MDNMDKIKVLVTGATGFIGRNIIQQLSRRSDLDITGSYFRSEPPYDTFPQVQWIQADLTNPSSVDRLVSGQDILIQAAAVTSGARDIISQPYLHVTDNAIMNALLFRSAFEHKIQHVVFFSCTTMYQSSRSPVMEEDFSHEIVKNYFGVGWTKVYNEKMCEFYSQIGSTKYTVIRHSNIYGPHDKFDLGRSHVFGATVTKVMTSKDDHIVVWGDGSEIRDLLYISDLVDFIEMAIERQRSSFELVNVGCGEGISIKLLVEKIIRISEKILLLKFDTSKPTIPFNLVVNIDKARRVFGWAPKISLDAGISKTLDWYIQNYLK